MVSVDVHAGIDDLDSLGWDSGVFQSRREGPALGDEPRDPVVERNRLRQPWNDNGEKEWTPAEEQQEVRGVEAAEHVRHLAERLEREGGNSQGNPAAIVQPQDPFPYQAGGTLRRKRDNRAAWRKPAPQQGDFFRDRLAPRLPDSRPVGDSRRTAGRTHRRRHVTIHSIGSPPGTCWTTFIAARASVAERGASSTCNW